MLTQENEIEIVRYCHKFRQIRENHKNRQWKVHLQTFVQGLFFKIMGLFISHF